MQKQNVVSDLLAYIPIKVLPAISSVLLVLAASKALAQEEYVMFSLGMAISLISMQLGVGWLGSPIIFFFPWAKNRILLLLSVSVLAVLAVALTITATAVITFAAVNSIVLSLVVSTMCATQSLHVVASAICQADRNTRLQMLMAVNLSAIVLLLIIIVINGFLANLVAIFAFLALAYLVAVLVFVRRGGYFSGLRYRPVTRYRVFPWFRRIFSYGAPFSIWSGSTLLIVSCDKLFVGNLDHSGVYLAGKDLLIGLSSLLSMPLIMTLHPVILLARKRPESFWRMVTEAVDLLSIAFAAALFFFNVLGFVFLELLIGKDLLPVKAPLNLVFFGMYLGSCLLYFQKRMEADGRTKLLAAIVLLVSIVSFFASSLIVPKGGLIYGAIIFVVAQLLCNAFVAGLSAKYGLLLRALMIFFVTYVVGEVVLYFSQVLFGRDSVVLYSTAATLVYGVPLACLAIYRLRRLAGVSDQ